MAMIMLFLGILPAHQAVAQEADKLVVAVVEVEPFVIRETGSRSESWTGLSVELWKQIATELELEYEFRPMSAAIARQSLQDGRVDVALGDFAINGPDYRHIDYSHPYLHSNYAVASLALKESAFSQVLDRFFSSTVLLVLGVLLVLMVFGGTVFWLMEKDRNPEMFKIDHGRFRFLNGAIWSFLLVTAQEPDVFKNSSLWGRLFATALLIVGITVSASYIALITSSLTVNEITTAHYGEEDLPDLRVLTLSNSSGIGYLNRHHLNYKIYPNMELAIEALEQGDADAVFADGIELIYHMRRHSNAPVALSPILQETEYIALAFPKGSDLVAKTNLPLIEFVETPIWYRLRSQYLGRSSAYTPQAVAD